MLACGRVESFKRLPGLCQQVRRGASWGAPLLITPAYKTTRAGRFLQAHPIRACNPLPARTPARRALREAGEREREPSEADHVYLASRAGFVPAAEPGDTLAGEAAGVEREAEGVTPALPTLGSWRPCGSGLQGEWACVFY